MTLPDSPHYVRGQTITIPVGVGEVTLDTIDFTPGEGPTLVITEGDVLTLADLIRVLAALIAVYYPCHSLRPFYLLAARAWGTAQVSGPPNPGDSHA